MPERRPALAALSPFSGVTMSIRSPGAALLCGAVFVASTAHAADADELRALREQIDQLKASYEERIKALESRVGRLQQQATAAPAAQATAAPGTQATAAPGAQAPAAPGALAAGSSPGAVAAANAAPPQGAAAANEPRTTAAAAPP